MKDHDLKKSYDLYVDYVNLYLEAPMDTYIFWETCRYMYKG